MRWVGPFGLDRLAYRIWRYTPSGLYRLYQHHRFDRRYGVDPRGYGDLRYEPTPAPVLTRMLELLDVDLSQFLFIDIGSGKGKVLFLASAFPFKKIVGIERFDEFHRIAEENLRIFPYTTTRSTRYTEPWTETFGQNRHQQTHVQLDFSRLRGEIADIGWD